MNKLLKNKTVIGIVAIIAGLLISFLLTPLYNSSLEEKTKIVRVKSEIQRGQAIKEDMLEEVEVGSYNLSENLVFRKSDAVGKYSKQKLYAGESILRSKLSNTPLGKDSYLENLDGSWQAISITVQSFAAGLSGKLLSGDIVSIIATDESQTFIPEELKYVKLLAATTEKGNDSTQTEEKKEEEETETVATVTLLVNEEQEKILANYEQNKKMHLALVYRGIEEKAKEFLDYQKQIMEEKNLEDSEIPEEKNTENEIEKNEVNKTKRDGEVN